MRKTEQTPKEKSKIYIKRALKAIRKYPKIKGYYVMSAADLARDIDYYPSAISGFLERLENKGLIKTKRSFAMFGTMHKIGIKILKEENESLKLKIAKRVKRGRR